MHEQKHISRLTVALNCLFKVQFILHLEVWVGTFKWSYLNTKLELETPFSVFHFPGDSLKYLQAWLSQHLSSERDTQVWLMCPWIQQFSTCVP